jgi:esterase/lipase
MHDRIIALAVAVALLIAACGSDQDPALPVETTSATTTESPATSAGTGATTGEASHPENVTFETSDGLTLEGRILQGDATWVVLGHMFPADMASWFEFADRIAAAGHTAFVYNNRGYGSSDGDKNDPRVATDGAAALDLARTRGATEIFYFGASMNGAAALALAAREDLAGIVTLSGVPEFGDTDGLAVIADITEPKLFIAAQDDFGAVDDAEDFFDRSAEPRELLIFDVGGHGTEMFEENADLLTETLLRFIAEH